MHLKCVLIKSDCWIKLVLTSKFCIVFYSTDQNKVSISGIEIVGMSGLLYMYLYRVLAGNFSPKSGLDKMSVFPMIGLGGFYCSN